MWNYLHIPAIYVLNWVTWPHPLCQSPQLSKTKAGKPIANSDQYCTSQEHMQRLKALFARTPDDVDMQLLLKELLSTFTSSDTDTTDVEMSEPHQTTPSHSSNAGPERHTQLIREMQGFRV